MSPSSLILHPDNFSGETSQCKGFLLQCSLYFSGGEPLSSYDHFIKLFQNKLFDHTPVSTEIEEQLLMVMQEKRNMAEYALEFRMLAARGGWYKPALSHLLSGS